MKPAELEPNLVNCELALHPEVLAVVTTTFYSHWYPGELRGKDDTDKIRGDLALYTVSKAHDLGHNVIVVDGTGEKSPFWSALELIGVIVESQKENGMDPARQQAFVLASEKEQVKVIAWIEPEKVSMTDPNCLWPASLAVLDGTYDLVIPRRDEVSFVTYPDYQSKYEKRANDRFNNILETSGLHTADGSLLDAWFGPRIFNKELLQYFTGRYDFKGTPEMGAVQNMHAKVKPGNYNSATFFPIIRALFEGKKVGSVTIPYRHPLEQTKNEMNNPKMEEKRHDQYVNIITACLHYVRYLSELSITTSKRSRISPIN